MYNIGIFTSGALKEATVTFKNKGYIAIDSVLDQKYIEQLYTTAPNINYDARGGYDDYYETIPWQEKERANELGNEIASKAHDHDFSYYHRISLVGMDTKFESELVQEFTQDIVRGGRLKDYIETVTGFEHLYTAFPTFSYYNKNHWITPHYDPTRKVAYLFYFNKVWKKHWGGDLCLLDEQDRVHTTIAPLGNRLVILDVSKPNFNKHFVSPVSRAGMNRYSLVGWYSERKPKNVN
tara:strand:+ start:7000 stop:7710 length:711 start_codon:yes stop_codon:yes gene_type:complete